MEYTQATHLFQGLLHKLVAWTDKQTHEDNLFFSHVSAGCFPVAELYRKQETNPNHANLTRFHNQWSGW